MPRAVQLDRYGSVDVLEVREVPAPAPAPERVVVEVVATSINPGEIGVREGAFRDQWPSTFPSGQGSDLAGRVVELGPDVTAWSVGDEVLGWTDERAAQADLVSVPIDQLVAKPPALGWDEASTLHVAGAAGWASVHAVAPRPGETVVVTGAAGGVGSVAVQLALRTGARVIGVAGAANQGWLTSLGAVAVPHGDGLAERLRAAAPDGLAALADTYGNGYVDLALSLGVPLERINTIIDFDAVQRLGVSAEGTSSAARAAVLEELAGLAASGELQITIAATYPLERVQQAYTELAQRHTRGKIVLRLRD